MKVKELMERAGIPETGRAIAYIKDGLQELNMMFSTHTDIERTSIIKDKRFYDFPDDMVKVIDIRMKNHRNDKDESIAVNDEIPKQNSVESKTLKDLGGTCYDTNLKEISDQLFFDKIERNYNKDFKFMIVEVDTEE